MRRFAFILIYTLYAALCAQGKNIGGEPLRKVFKSDVYGAHIRNFDLACDTAGNLYVANFEGLLYYDHATWRIYHTPDVTRIISIDQDTDGTIIAYDYLGKPYSLRDETLVLRDDIAPKPNIIEKENPKALDGRGGEWSISEAGIIYTAKDSPYIKYTKEEGLEGEVLSILENKEKLYVGTTKGLLVFSCKDNRFHQINTKQLACWQLTRSKDGAVLAATADGVFRIEGENIIRLTNENTLTVLADSLGGYYAGEMFGVYNYFDATKPNSNKRLIKQVNKPTKLCIDNNGSLWIETMYGKVIHNMFGETDGTIIETSEGVFLGNLKRAYKWDYKNLKFAPETILENCDISKYYFPQFAFMDRDSITFLSMPNGRGLQTCKNRKKLDNLNLWLRPMEKLNVRAVETSKDNIAVGGAFGVFIIDKSYLSRTPRMPRLEIRTAKISNRTASFSYSIDSEQLPGKCLYSYRINKGVWSDWDDDCDVFLNSLPYGDIAFQVRFLDPYGRTGEAKTYRFNNPYPFYMRWYSILLYIALLVIAIRAFMKYRMDNLKKQKEKLEKIVAERTAELQVAQQKILRQEKLSVVEKLTQGLIDRILNPMNYILNFVKLNQGLSKDLELDITDEEERMDKDNYDDCLDIISMLRDNQKKIEEHSANTTRILKAMEEMLKDRTGNMQEVCLTTITKKCKEQLLTYYANEIKQMDIKVNFTLPDHELLLTGNGELLSKSFMSMIANSVYSIKKKYERNKFQPEIFVRLTEETAPTDEKKKIVLTLRDNGIGIEKTIADKIFDPFFTTKPTADAAGVGLYLVKDNIQNHNGEIVCHSEQGEFCEFVITIRQ